MDNKAKKLIDIILSHEGFYANVAGDRGGETYMGISRKAFPRWVGWQIIDQHKPLKYNQHIKDDNLDDIVRRFYYNNFYIKLKVDNITDELISAHLLDHAVNTGLKNGVRVLQRAINEMSAPTIKVDGIIGQITLDKINELDNEELAEYIVMHRRKYYQAIVKKSPSQKKFLKGWLRRVDDTTKSLQPKLTTVLFTKMKNSGILEKILRWLFSLITKKSSTD